MTVYLGLGSNIGDREDHLRSAVRGLNRRGIDITRCASVYSAEPRELLDQPWFLNTVLEASTNFSPEQLLTACLDIERENHRLRVQPKGPRTLDIDILFCGDTVIRTPDLTLPHPSFSSRRFVLVPLAEIAPQFVDPRSGRTIRQLLEECTDAATVTLVYDARAFWRPFPNARQ